MQQKVGSSIVATTHAVTRIHVSMFDDMVSFVVYIATSMIVELMANLTNKDMVRELAKRDLSTLGNMDELVKR